MTHSERSVTHREPMAATPLYVPLERRVSMVELLNQQLADTFDLYSQVKQAHWAIAGHAAFPLHLLFDTLSANLAEFVDVIAERITALGGVPRGTVRMAAAASRLPELAERSTTGMAYVAALVGRYAAVSQSMHAAIDVALADGSAETAALLNDVSRGLHRGLRFLESHVAARFGSPGD